MLFGCTVRVCVRLCVGVCDLIAVAHFCSPTYANAFMKYENRETNHDKKKPLFSMFVLPQSSRRGDDIVVSDADMDVVGAAAAAVAATVAAAAVFIDIAEVVAKHQKHTHTHKIKHYGITNMPAATKTTHCSTPYCGCCYCRRWAQL